ncbi:hypothetical protein [Pantoea endophytica]
MKAWTNIIFLMLCLFIQGCDDSRITNKLSKSDGIDLTVKVPSGLVSLPLNVMYRSNDCKQDRINAKGEVYDVPGFKKIIPSPSSSRNDGALNYQIPIALSGVCNWAVSNVTVVLQVDNRNLGLVENIPSEIILSFDENPPQVSNGLSENITSDGVVHRVYYPILTRRYIGGNKTIVSLFDGNTNFTYNAKGLSKITYAPDFFESNVVERDSPRIHGGDFTIKYSDGTILKDGSIYPDIDKLNSIN